MKKIWNLLTITVLLCFCSTHSKHILFGNPITRKENLIRFDYYPVMEGEENGRMDVKVASELKELIVGISNNEEIQIDSFNIQLYNKKEMVKSYTFIGNTAPNIFTNYTLYEVDEKGNEVLKSLTHFILKVFIHGSDDTTAKAVSRLIYFYV